MAANTEPLPGTSDLWMPEVQEWLALEKAARDIFPRYGYNELRTPIIERTDVFVRGLGDETEVVQKEMYTFEDRGGRSISLRPEGTAGVMRAIAEHGLNPGEEQRVFYIGPMFRGERPAKGRKRQFHQVGVEAVGRCAPAMDAENIAMLVHFLAGIGIGDAKVKLNTRGTVEDRAAIDAALRLYFQGHAEAMCEDCRRRVAGNVWRILDCKNDLCQSVIEGAPHILDLVGEASRNFFSEVCKHLDAFGIDYEISHRLVRGLDYYEHTIFELTHHGLGAQDALAGGGRYKIYLPGAKLPVEGVGFACGMERLLLAREALGVKSPDDSCPQIYVVGLGAEGVLEGLRIAQVLRKAGFRVLAETGERGMRAQMRAANKAGVRFAVIIGENEVASGTASIKDMTTSEQGDVAFNEVATALVDKLNHGTGRPAIGHQE